MTMSRQQQVQKYHDSQPTWDDHDEDNQDYFDEYDDYGDYSINQQRGGGGKTKTEKRQANRGGGSSNVYSSKHIRAKVSQRIAQK